MKAVTVLQKFLRSPNSLKLNPKYVLELLEGLLEMVGCLTGPEEHGGLVKVQDDVVEEEVADFEEDVAGLNFLI